MMFEVDSRNRLPLNWYQAIFVRKSRRSFLPQVPEEEKMARVEQFCRDFRPFSGARAELIRRSPERVFRGIVGGFGKISGAPFYAAFVGDEREAGAAEGVGYTGEGILLEATSLGLGTCWVSGLFHRDVVRDQISFTENERVFAVTPIGYAEHDFTFKEKFYMGAAASGKRKPLDELVEGPVTHPWQDKALEAARISPSASNRQPWRFVLGPDDITVRTDKPRDSRRFPRRLDCGIAMLHLELGAQAAGVRGKWTPLPAPDVARFEVPENAVVRRGLSS